MDILSNIQDFIANPSQPITQEWLDEVQQQYPYFNLPALLYLKQHGIEGNEELLGKLAISCADRKVLSTHLGDGADLFRDFYPQEKEEPTTTTTHAIDMFLDAFGNKPIYEDRGIRKRAILAVGKQDFVNDRDLIPLDEGVEIVGSSSDHLIVDLQNSKKDFKVGDVMSFGMFYSCALYLTSSKYVSKKYVELKALHKEYA